ncbi:unnamed protein product [Natator depressus]
MLGSLGRGVEGNFLAKPVHAGCVGLLLRSLFLQLGRLGQQRAENGTGRLQRGLTPQCFHPGRDVVVRGWACPPPCHSGNSFTAGSRAAAPNQNSQPAGKGPMRWCAE